MEFKCSGCNYLSDLKNNVKRHILTKQECKKSNIVIIELDIICDYCKKSFATKPNLNKHLKLCKIKKVDIELDLVKKNEEIKKLREENELLKTIAMKPNNVFNQNNNININLAPWNDPRLPDDVEKYYREAVKKIFLAVPTIIKYIHFNSEHPENHNICIKNARTKTAKVYNGKEWESIDEDQLIRTLINDYENTLEDYAEDKNPKYIKAIQEIKERDTEEKVYDDLHNEVKRVIYDRNHMVKIKN
jgi:hypothetical protein